MRALRQRLPARFASTHLRKWHHPGRQNALHLPLAHADKKHKKEEEEDEFEGEDGLSPQQVGAAAAAEAEVNVPSDLLLTLH